MSVLAVPRRIVLDGYKGKHTLGRDDTYLHFLNIAYNIAKIAITDKYNCDPHTHGCCDFLVTFCTIITPVRTAKLVV